MDPAQEHMILHQFYLNCLAHASYLVVDEQSGAAAVIDPQRDVDQYVSFAAERGLAIRHVILTHFHADHVVGASGVLRGREVGAIEGTGLHEPVEGVRGVEDAVGRVPGLAAYGETRQVGAVTVQAVWPRPGARAGDDSGRHTA